MPLTNRLGAARPRELPTEETPTEETSGRPAPVRGLAAGTSPAAPKPPLTLVSAGGNAIRHLTLRWGSRLLSRIGPWRNKSATSDMQTAAVMEQSLVTPILPAAVIEGDGWRHTGAGGRFEVRLCRNAADLAAAQQLRYRVFYQEMNATPSPAMAAMGRDFDDYDPICDHLVVLDHQRLEGQTVVGTYRLLRHALAVRHQGFYSASEYDLAPLLEAVPDRGGLLELGRSCVHPEYRTNATIQLLWRGIATYIADHQISHMFGCASLPGIDLAALALPLSYLHHNHLAPEGMRVAALPERRSPMDLLPAETISPRRAVQALPPLIKAYLRLGAFIGDGAVIDRQFNTTDVFILLPTERIAEKYFSRFDREEAAAPAV